MQATIAQQPRARGRLEVVAQADGPQTRLARLHQAGALRALFPRGAGMLAITLNTSGGVTGGDQFDVSAEAGPGARLTVSTQAAERFYRAQPGQVGKVSTRLTAGAGARLDWVPQETILFDGAAVTRRLRANIAADARLVIVEPMVFGRAAMGEQVTQLDLTDRIDITRDGVPVFADRVKISGDAAQILQNSATAGGAGAQAALIVVSPDAEQHLNPLRQLMQGRGGASVIRPGVCFARVVAQDGYALRQVVLPAMRALGVDIPRTWML